MPDTVPATVGKQMKKASPGAARSMEQEAGLRENERPSWREARQTALTAPRWAPFTISGGAGSSYKRDSRLAVIVGIIIVHKAQLLEPLSDFSIISNQ